MRIAFLAPYTKKYFHQICRVRDRQIVGNDVWFLKCLPERSVEVDTAWLASLTWRGPDSVKLTFSTWGQTPGSA